MISTKLITLLKIIDLKSTQLTGTLLTASERRGGLMVSVLDSGSNGLGSSPGQVIVLFLGKTLYSYSASLHPEVNGYQQTVKET